MSRMSAEQASLIEIVFAWDRVQDKKDAKRRKEYWLILDALYADSPRRRSPEFKSQVERILDSLKPSDTIERIRKQLGLPGKEP